VIGIIPVSLNQLLFRSYSRRQKGQPPYPKSGRRGKFFVGKQIGMVLSEKWRGLAVAAKFTTTAYHLWMARKFGDSR